MKRASTTSAAVALTALVLLPCVAHAAEHVTLRNGFEMDCARREVLENGRIRLFMLSVSSEAKSADPGYIDVTSDAVVGVESIPDPVFATHAETAGELSPGAPLSNPTKAQMHTMLASAGNQHNIDEDLLAAVVKAESGGNAHAVSRTGARGLMQLMPGTASVMGIGDAFQPQENIAGGTAYLDQLLVRYHDDATLALAAYNAGPGAVDRYHGIPPYRETRAYVARVIAEFNRRKRVAKTETSQLAGIR